MTIKRTFALTCGGENKTRIHVHIIGKDGFYQGYLPKDQIKITNRGYGFGGAKWADIELPVELIPEIELYHRFTGAEKNAKK